MKKTDNKILILLIVILFIICVSSQVFAIDTTQLEKYKGTEDDSTDVINKGKVIISIFKAAGNIISVIALMIIGIKYMMSSVEEKADMKQSLLIYIIGAILVFGIGNISQLIYNWANNI